MCWAQLRIWGARDGREQGGAEEENWYRVVRREDEFDFGNVRWHRWVRCDDEGRVAGSRFRSATAGWHERPG